MSHELILGDCLEKMKEIPAGSVDMIMTDPPYGTTANSWDSVIPLEPMWALIEAVCKPSAAIVIMATQPFASVLIMSNIDIYRHEWIWIKNRPTNFLNAKREPMREHEYAIVFSRGKWKYNPQGQERRGRGLDIIGKKNYHGGVSRERGENGESSYRSAKSYTIEELPELRCPASWQYFKTPAGQQRYGHTTQKPVALMEYLIRTYTDEGERVLDFAMGSGSTGSACLNTARDFIGIEKDAKIFEIAKKRISEGQLPLIA